jgi:hypothetical protein
MDLFAMNFDDFEPQPNFFPYFPVLAGKMPSPWAALRPPYELLPEFRGFGLERPGCAG